LQRSEPCIELGEALLGLLGILFRARRRCRRGRIGVAPASRIARL
jgi:hypothetical protein